MTLEDATSLVNKFSKVYLSPYREKLPEMDSARWIRLIMDTKLSYKGAGDILTAFVAANPPKHRKDGQTTGTMPYIGDLKQFIKDRIAPKIPDCPCCCGDKWIYLKEIDGVIACDCYLAAPEEKRISCVYYPTKKCEIFNCDPNGKVLRNNKINELGECPKRKEHYAEYLLKSKERAIPDPEDMPF